MKFLIIKTVVSVVVVEICLVIAVQGQYYLNDGVIKFIAGLGIPVDVGMSGGSISMFTNFQVFYKLPDNISYYEPYRVMQKRSIRNTFNRYNVYKALTKYFERLGFTGDDCIYRLICETAGGAIYTNGILGKIIRILFSPGNDVQYGLEKHKLAQWRGNNNSSECELVYSNCFLEENSRFFN